MKSGKFLEMRVGWEFEVGSGKIRRVGVRVGREWDEGGIREWWE